jgi:hypothetical protein
VRGGGQAQEPQHIHHHSLRLGETPRLLAEPKERCSPRHPPHAAAAAAANRAP